MEPEYFNFDEYKIRLAKLNKFAELGVEPYPHSYNPTTTVEDLVKNPPEALDFETAKQTSDHAVRIAGRVMLSRPMGTNIFVQLQEGNERIQVLFNRGVVKVKGLLEDQEVTAHKFLEKWVDLGDFLGIEGQVFRTQKGELTIFAKEVTFLSKSLLPLPDKYSGLKNKEIRYRKRWLDLIANPEVFEIFRMRSKIFALIREYFTLHKFLEVETPVLSSVYGGANARPFTTHLNALKQDMYLRIALELPLKELIIGGFQRVYEMGRLFRNEGIDATHNPEFSMVEAYAAYWDYNDVMKFTEELYAYVAKGIYGTTKIGVRKDRKGNEHEVDVQTPWIRLTMKESIKKYAGYDVDALSDDEMRKILLEKADVDPAKIKKAKRGILVATFFEEFVEHHLIQPHHITDHPIETTPLCKYHRSPSEKAQGIVERFESFFLGMEITNAYSELNDPLIQRSLLEEQERLLLAGDEEANPIDEDFLEAMNQGMPPTGGVGIGLDRLVMIITGATSIRDVLFFPLMKPEHSAE
ncbi:MAG: lysine--tRNA ligase [Chlamydiae bacterium]|nr:lysine--tRNA ligase [Chlamydiota bacterium]